MKKPVKSETPEQRLTRALARMNALIDQGYEYPDAQYKAAAECGVSHEDLGFAYDEQYA